MLQRFPYDPVPGVAVALLGLAAVVVAVRLEMEMWEKIGWILVATVLFVAEIHSIYIDRDKHELEQSDATKAQLRGFADIGGGIEQSVHESDRNFQDTMARSDKILTGLSSSIGFQTGGDSFLYVSVSDPVSLNNGNEFVPVGLPIVQGQYPLHDVQAEGQQIETRQPWVIQYGTMYPQNTGELGRARYAPPHLEFKDNHKEPVVTNISLSASNGSYFEEIQFRKNKSGKWRKAMRVINNTGAKRPIVRKTCIDPDYPENPIDWNR